MTCATAKLVQMVCGNDRDGQWACPPQRRRRQLWPRPLHIYDTKSYLLIAYLYTFILKKKYI